MAILTNNLPFDELVSHSGHDIRLVKAMNLARDYITKTGKKRRDYYRILAALALRDKDEVEDKEAYDLSDESTEYVMNCIADDGGYNYLIRVADDLDYITILEFLRIPDDNINKLIRSYTHQYSGLA